MKTFEFYEYSYVLNRYPAQVEISDEDFSKLQNEEIEIVDIIDKYLNDIEYDNSEQIFDDSYLDPDEPYEIITDLESKEV